jgi:16S rRNA (cytidine1402-2'-O)-methyltransferase
VESVQPGTLYLIATPIGNLEDISLRALRILREVDVVAAEDTRHTRKLLAHHGIPARLVSLREHNERARTPELVARLQAGERIALVSDAGTPGLSDPGQVLVRAAAAAGVPVVPVPGPSAFLSALVASGLPTAPVTFLGFLPAARGERRAALDAVRALPHTLVVYEAPHRLLAALRDLLDVLGDRRAAVARELTKVHEEVFRGRLREALQHFSAHPPRGEFTLVIEGAPPGRAGARPEARGEAGAPPEPPAAGEDPARARQAHARAVLRAALARRAAPFEAVRRAAQASGLRRNEVYRLWLAIKQEAAR